MVFDMYGYNDPNTVMPNFTVNPCYRDYHWIPQSQLHALITSILAFAEAAIF